MEVLYINEEDNRYENCDIYSDDDYCNNSNNESEEFENYDEL
jgi:hypothetical protein